MKLGIARHFQIPHNRYQFLNGPGFDKWAEWYDTTEVSPRQVPAAGADFDACLCSDLHRAHFTAQTIFKGAIETTPLLREVPFTPFLPGPFWFPLFMWQATSRMGWYINRSTQRETRTQTQARIAAFMERLKRDFSDRNLLIVTHGFFMQFLQKELLAAGFRGSLPMRPHGGTIYLFES